MFLKGERIAGHMRGSGRGKHTHPGAHAFQSSPLCRLDHRADHPGSDADRTLAGDALPAGLEHRPRPEQGFRTTLGIVRLAKLFGAARWRPHACAPSTALAQRRT
jgi:hypothetical protein